MKLFRLIVVALFIGGVAHAQTNAPLGPGGGGSSGGGGGLNGFLTCTAGVCTFTGADGSTQMVVGTTNSSVDWLSVVGGISGAGGSIVAQSGTDANVAVNITAKGNANVNFANSGSGQLAQGLDPGAAVLSGGQVQISPNTASQVGWVGNTTYGINLNCGTAEVCNAGGQPIATFGGVYALNVNGDFQIDQLNEGSALLVNNQRATDGWFSTSTQGAKFTYQRSTTVPPGGYYYTSGSLTNGASGYTPISTDKFHFHTSITGQEAAILRWGSAAAKAVTIDVCIIGDSSLTYPALIPVYVNNNNGGSSYRTFVHNVSLSASTVATCTSISVPGDTSGTWFGPTSAGLFNFGIGLGCGSNFTTSTLDAWQTGEAYCGSASTQLVTVANGHINVTGFHVRLGTQNYIASPFQELPYTLEYAKARQRYWKSFAVGTKPAQNVGTNTGEIQFPATVATTGTQRAQSVLWNLIAAPTVTFFNPAAANANCRDETAAGDGGTGTATNTTSTGVNPTCTGNASTALNNIIGVHLTADTNL